MVPYLNRIQGCFESPEFNVAPAKLAPTANGSSGVAAFAFINRTRCVASSLFVETVAAHSGRPHDNPFARRLHWLRRTAGGR